MTARSLLSRMTIDIPAEDHKRLKALAAVLGKSMREIIAEKMLRIYFVNWGSNAHTRVPAFVRT